MISATLLGALLVALGVALWPSTSTVARRRLAAVCSGARPAGADLRAGLRLDSPRVADLADQLASALDAGLAMPVAWHHVLGRLDAPCDRDERAGHGSFTARAAGGGPARAAALTPTDAAARMALTTVAAALELSDAGGVGAAHVLRAAAVSIRDQVDAEAARSAAASGPVAAAWIVGGLPVVGPMLAAALGMDPVGVLTGTAWGRGCGAAGLMFLLVGVAWSRALVIRARAEAAA